MDFPVIAPGNSGQQTIFGKKRLFTDVGKDEGTGTVGILHFARLETALSKQSSLLVTNQCCNRTTIIEKVARINITKYSWSILNLWKHGFRNVKYLK